MSARYKLEREVRDLGEELDSAKSELKELESQQKLFLDNVRKTSVLTLVGAISELQTLVTYVCKVDAALLKHSKHPKLIKYVIKKVAKKKTVSYIIDHGGSKVEDMCSAVEEVFEEAEETLNSKMQEVMDEEERVTEIAVTRVGIIQNKINDTKEDVSKQIVVTEKAIDECEQEKEVAEENKSKLWQDARELDRKASGFEERRSDARNNAIGGSVLGLLGALITPVAPMVGIPMIGWCGGWAIGAGIASSELTGEINKLRNKEAQLELKMTRLQERLSTLRYSTLPDLEQDKTRFDGLDTDLCNLRSRSKDLQSMAGLQVSRLTEAKASISMATSKISELNAHIIQLGYTDTRAELAGVLDTIVGKLSEGNEKLGDRTIEASSDLSLVSAKIREIRTTAPRVLTIMNHDTQKRALRY
ncbi:hypothetical protein ABW20_dc0102001 [Dactylellina cionopaga]|nr:hypothetical protein ABW20_dc0102001 [Dactylellina cionopaga]